MSATVRGLARFRRGLTPAQLAVIPLILSGESQASAARKVGVDPSTIRRWLKTPGHKFAVALAKHQEILDQVRASLLELALGKGSVSTARIRAILIFLGIEESALRGDPTCPQFKPSKAFTKVLGGPSS